MKIGQKYVDTGSIMLSIILFIDIILSLRIDVAYKKPIIAENCCYKYNISIVAKTSLNWISTFETYTIYFLSNKHLFF